MNPMGEVAAAHELGPALMLGGGCRVKQGTPEVCKKRSRACYTGRGMRAAAVDLGSVRVGLAVGDELGLMAHPRPFLPAGDPKALFDALSRLVSEEGVEVFVVGLPRMLDGRESPGSRRARRFAERLRARTGVRVERLSTVVAQGRLRAQGLDSRAQRSRIDSASAAILLQSWLDAQRGPTE
jgi:putative Holliday junction resolvase